MNQPNIAQIHGFEDGDGAPALVMGYVEGETLAERVAKGPIPLDEALSIAKQITAALEAVTADGQRFLIPLVPSEDTSAGPQPIAVVLNWSQILR